MIISLKIDCRIFFCILLLKLFNDINNQSVAIIILEFHLIEIMLTNVSRLSYHTNSIFFLV